jgi:hypothetical protein
MTDWIGSHAAFFGPLAIASAILFVGSLLALPWLVAQIPRDYFLTGVSHRLPWADRHPLVRGAFVIGKNLLGVVFLIAGIAMLVLPGQGLLTMVVGLVLVDFPGKGRLLRRIVAQPTVLSALNWLRRRAHREPLVVDSLKASRR